MANQTRDTNDEYPSISDESGPDENISYFPACQSLTRLAMSAVTVSRIADGVREKRGAGAGWVTP